ncbi:SUMO-specific isopeptidase USPL1 isoform X2 [Oryctolagus cuniculus]|uniref:SUMO-specific isopeptidase USPL1 isoform X2 n=1 Tax=Oryctolagus cuniculus TaxID=9986 RepID=UPI0038791F9A
MMDSPKIGNGLPVIGPGTDIGISSLHMVGYLGKNYDPSKVPSDGYCPACREKGKLKALKTYRISFQESIFLCEDLQCIYPLGFKSLNNLISPGSEDCHTPNKPHKRKLLETSYNDAPVLANSKKTRHHIIDGEPILDSKYNGEVYNETSSKCSDGSTQQHPIGTAYSLEQNKVLEAGIVDMATKDDPSTVDISGVGQTSPQNEGGTSELEIPLESKCTSSRRTFYVQWKNAHALCWLDCILSALVHLEGLKNTVTELCSKEESVFWQLFTKYNQANKLLSATQLDEIKGGDYKKLPSKILAEIETCLNEVRAEIFSRLQPLLRCTLGDMESPVFAFPLLLKLEPHIEKLFTYSFSWDFECSQCGHQYQHRCTKSLVTFTNVIPEWHPLNAAHFGPCNNCNNKSQIRKMVLEKSRPANSSSSWKSSAVLKQMCFDCILPAFLFFHSGIVGQNYLFWCHQKSCLFKLLGVSPIFMVHFVEGLPQKDLQRYAFHLEGCLYEIKSIIQYQASNHFITWILDADGSWLECDDLKGLCSERHEEFEIPASEIHIVIWERKTSQVTDKEGARLLLEKPSDEHASGAEQPASPALCPGRAAPSAGAASMTHPAGRSVALPPGDAVAPGDHFLPEPKDWVANKVLPLTLKETVQETASVVQVNSQSFPNLENKPVAENTGIVETRALPSQDSLTASSVSDPCKEKQVQDQCVGLGVPSQVVNTNMASVQPNTGDSGSSKSVSDSHAAVLTQGVEATEMETSAQFKQSFPQKLEELKSEQHTTSQLSNLEEKKPVAEPQTFTVKSLQSQCLKENQKKPFVGSWVKGLLSRGASFMPLCVSACNRDTVLHSVVTRANSVDGFKGKGRNQKGKQVSKKSRRHAGKPLPVQSPPPACPPAGTAAPPPASKTAAPAPPPAHTAAPPARIAAPPAPLPLRPAAPPPASIAPPPPASMAAPPPASIAPPPPASMAAPPPASIAPPPPASMAAPPPASKTAAPGPPPAHMAAPPARIAAPASSAASEGLKKCENTSYRAHLSHSPLSSAKHGDSVEGQIHKLRLKLLKKLKAKKKKLATLKSSPQNGTLASEHLEQVSQCESPNDCDSLEDLLNELQFQIDIADKQPGCTPVSDVSSYSGQTHEDILAELLSPTNTVSTELSDNGDVDFGYLEMGDNCIPAPVPSELNDIPQNTHLRQDHNYCSPSKKNQCEVQPDLATSNACIKTLSLESPVKTDIFDEFFSTSALNPLVNDTLDLPHFDEYLFENF